jgi:hypothetical protein
MNPSEIYTQLHPHCTNSVKLIEAILSGYSLQDCHDRRVAPNLGMSALQSKYYRLRNMLRNEGYIQ